MESPPRELTLALHCQRLPGTACMGQTGVRLGIQKGRTVIDDLPADAPEILFAPTLGVKTNPRTGALDFTGPFAQGKLGERFLYLCWGERNGAFWEGFARAKLLLHPLQKEVVEKALSTGQPLHIILTLTNPKGNPVCARIKEEDITWPRAPHSDPEDGPASDRSR